MSNNSVNTNAGANVALRNLNSINRDLSKVQNRVSTGLRVATAKDDASVFSVAQGIRANVNSYDAINSAISQGRGLVTVALAGVEGISNSVTSVKEKLVQLSNAANTNEQSNIYAQDLSAILNDIQSFINSAVFNGGNLLTSDTSFGGLSSNVNVVAAVDGSQATIRTQGTAFGGAGGAFEAFSTSFAALVAATTASDRVALIQSASLNEVLLTFQSEVAQTLGQLGADDKSLQNKLTFNESLRDATEEALGALVDADMARESARLTALQTKQQLATQTLAIANSSTQIVLNLFQ